jgi:3',5'-cyclic AMP phosphodiesterase CpdA
MRKLVHLSDLHLGRIDADLPGPLADTIRQLDPHLLVVSGDLTQRARSHQFALARTFLDSLAMPRIVVPGNHDIPLHNLFDRMWRPLEKYRRHLGDEVEPEYLDDEIAVFGVNTARSLTFKDGRISHAQLARLEARLASLPASLSRVIVTHHPLDLPAHAAGNEAALDMAGGYAVGRAFSPKPCRRHRGALSRQRIRGAGGAGRHGDVDPGPGRIEFLQLH